MVCEFCISMYTMPESGYEINLDVFCFLNLRKNTTTLHVKYINAGYQYVTVRKNKAL
jgi:hypothetical protein